MRSAQKTPHPDPLPASGARGNSKGKTPHPDPLPASGARGKTLVFGSKGEKHSQHSKTPQDREQDGFGIAENLVVADPKDPKADGSLQVDLSCLVLLRSTIVTPPINFDDEAGGRTIEIHDEWPDSVLSSELEPTESSIA